MTLRRSISGCRHFGGTVAFIFEDPVPNCLSLTLEFEEDRNTELYRCENVKTHLKYVIVCIIFDAIFDLSLDML